MAQTHRQAVRQTHRRILQPVDRVALRVDPVKIRVLLLIQEYLNEILFLENILKKKNLTVHMKSN